MAAELPPGPLFILQNPKQISTLIFSKFDSDILYAANRNGDLSVYNLETRRLIFTANTSKDSILSICELDNLNLLTHSRNGSIFKWTKQSDSFWTFNCIYEKPIYTFCQFEFADEKNILFLPSTNASTIDFIDISTHKRVNSLTPQLETEKKGMLMNLKVVDSNYLIAGYENGELSLYDLRSLKETNKCNLFAGQPLMCFDFCRKANIGIAGSSELIVKTFKLIENEKNEFSDLKEVNSLNLVNPGLNSIKIRKCDSKLFALGGWDSRIRIYSLKKQKLLAVLDFHKEAINAIDFSTDGLMAAGSNDGIITFWDLYK